MKNMNSLQSDGDSTNLAYNSTSTETTIVSARTPVHYPWWVHLMALLVFSVNCAKIPHATSLVGVQLPSFVPDGSTMTAIDSQAAMVGATIFCILSGLVGAIVLYLLHRYIARAFNRGGAERLCRVSMWEFVVALALIFPDLWFVVIGTNPYTSWQFLSIFSSVIVLVTLIKGDYKNLLTTLPSALLLGFAM